MQYNIYFSNLIIYGINILYNIKEDNIKKIYIYYGNKLTLNTSNSFTINFF